MNRKKKILVIDDDPVLVKITTMALEREGYEIMTAHDGHQGLKVLQENEFDCLLVDLRMPNMDGIEFIKQSREKLGLTIPIIVLSAMDKPYLKDQLLLLRITKFLHKPVTVNTLKETVKAVL